MELGAFRSGLAVAMYRRKTSLEIGKIEGFITVVLLLVLALVAVNVLLTSLNLAGLATTLDTSSIGGFFSRAMFLIRFSAFIPSVVPTADTGGGVGLGNGAFLSFMPPNRFDIRRGSSSSSGVSVIT